MYGQPIAIYLAIVVPAMFVLSLAVGHWEPFLGAIGAAILFGVIWLVAKWAES